MESIVFYWNHSVASRWVSDLDLKSVSKSFSLSKDNVLLCICVAWYQNHAFFYLISFNNGGGSLTALLLPLLHSCCLQQAMVSVCTAASRFQWFPHMKTNMLELRLCLWEASKDNRNKWSNVWEVQSDVAAVRGERGIGEIGSGNRWDLEMKFSIYAFKQFQAFTIVNLFHCICIL